LQRPHFEHEHEHEHENESRLRCFAIKKTKWLEAAVFEIQKPKNLLTDGSKQTGVNSDSLVAGR
jgi:hypothetical protein